MHGVSDSWSSLRYKLALSHSLTFYLICSFFCFTQIGPLTRVLFWEMKDLKLNVQYLQSFSVSKHPFHLDLTTLSQILQNINVNKAYYPSHAIYCEGGVSEWSPGLHFKFLFSSILIFLIYAIYLTFLHSVKLFQSIQMCLYLNEFGWIKRSKRIYLVLYLIKFLLIDLTNESHKK